MDVSEQASPTSFDLAIPSLEAGRRVRLPGPRVKELTRLSPTRALAHIAFEWGAIVAAAVLCERFFGPAVYLLTVIWIGARQHTFAIMTHEGVHNMITRSKPWNDAITQLLLAWPVLMPFHSYRDSHRQHHRHLNTENDPDWVRNRPDRLRDCTSWLQLIRLLVGLESGHKTLFQAREEGDSRPATRSGLLTAARVLRAAFYVAVVSGFAATGYLRELALYWVVPLVTWYIFVMRLKGTAEHFALENTEPLNASRTLTPTSLERLFLAPKNVHYHLDHHFYPSVPFYRLGRLHRALMELPDYRQRAHVTPTYLDFLRECVRYAALGRSVARPA